MMCILKCEREPMCRKDLWAQKNSNSFNSEFFGDNRWLFDICREGLLIQGGFWSPGLRNSSGQLGYFYCNSYSCTFLRFTHLHLFWGYSLDIFVVTFGYFWDRFCLLYKYAHLNTILIPNRTLSSLNNMLNILTMLTIFNHTLRTLNNIFKHIRHF